MQQSSSSNSEATVQNKNHDYTIDFILSILFASLKSFKGESLMKPLPDFAASFEQLMECHDQTYYPPVNMRTDSVRNQKFLDWTALLAGQIEVTPYNNDDFVGLVGSLTVKRNPNFIVKLKNPKVSQQFEHLAVTHGVSIGFHGTHTENVFSIFQNGLVGHLNKRALFGPGIYLSSDLDVALSFAKQGKSWPRSYICQNMTCVLVCKVINSDQVKQGKAKLSGISLKTNALPHNYYVVQNNDHVSVTHLLLYSAKQRRPSCRNAESKLVLFVRCYGFVLFYGLILVFICLCSNGFIKKWMKKLM